MKGVLARWDASTCVHRPFLHTEDPGSSLVCLSYPASLAMLLAVLLGVHVWYAGDLHRGMVLRRRCHDSNTRVRSPHYYYYYYYYYHILYDIRSDNNILILHRTS